MITLREISPRFRQWNTSPDFDHERVVQACLAWCHDEGRARLEHRPVLLQLSTMSPRWAEGARLTESMAAASKAGQTSSARGDVHMRSDMVPGAAFPDYELSDHTAKHRKLSELQGQHPMVLVLSRGGFCPKDRRQHEGLVQLDLGSRSRDTRVEFISSSRDLRGADFWRVSMPRRRSRPFR
jgi:hypothetical protein